MSFPVDKFYVDVDVDWKEEGDWIGQKQDKRIGQEEDEEIGVEKVKKRHQTFLSSLESLSGKLKSKCLFS